MLLKRIRNLYGQDQRKIEATYWQATDTQSEKVAIVLPGYLYPPDAPATFYLKLLFMKYKWDYMTIDYRYNENEAFLNSADDEKMAYFKKDQEKLAEYIIENYKHKTVCLIGKSIGTTAIHSILESSNLLSEMEAISFILLTPTEVQGEIVKTVSAENKNLLFIIGDKDQYYSEDVLLDVQKKSTMKTKVIDNAGHLFEDQSDDITQSIENIKEITAFVEEQIQDGFFG
ncbi:MAG: hypothetical protein ACOC7X_09950 [Spirochaetota bacterium]